MGDPRYNYRYWVEVPLAGSENWFQLVECVTPEAVGEVVRALLAAGGPCPDKVRVVKYPAD
jgi:hypothetical protein